MDKKLQELLNRRLKLMNDNGSKTILLDCYEFKKVVKTIEQQQANLKIYETIMSGFEKQVKEKDAEILGLKSENVRWKYMYEQYRNLSNEKNAEIERLQQNFKCHKCGAYHV